MDPYEALGVSKTASAAEIKKAYRKIVKESHPDINPGDKAGEARFKAAAAAYDLLKDPEKRARFDRGEIDASGQERPEANYYRNYAGARDNPYRGGQRFDDYEDLSDFFSDFMRSQRGARGGAGHDHMHGFHSDGEDLRYRLEVPFMDAALGGTTRITLPDGSVLQVQIPRGIADGQTIRLKGKGGAPVGKGRQGDALVTVSVAPHKVFSREGDTIRVVLPITIDEAILGGKVEVPTISGPVNLTIPKGASSGQVLRLRGRGIAPRGREDRGDQLVELKIVAPPSVDDELASFFEAWKQKHSYDPRKGMKT
ncbi:DnaJ C-terminal domain-containing protein [Tropicimonas sediminicola]|uniref:DnaJ-class molecular chaperone with C-terminal Zn finger domain n=1 Tax=Tropicimonas sediminicola TaxID=1031541 RepID=A0A239EH21_9RHOB|nr:DnaJ C-terminal domain-containing protein [Tropicimonas sediminicola]SNS43313.1 DnaJ-class molecular chaperone with C-terminal Zn finger domain [Tropicimonas sediminicola]